MHSQLISGFRRGVAAAAAGLMALGLAACAGEENVTVPTAPAPLTTEPATTVAPDPDPTTPDPVTTEPEPEPDPVTTEPVEADISEADWETVKLFAQAVFENDYELAETYAEPRTPAMGYVVHNLTYQATTQDNPRWEIPPLDTVSDDRAGNRVVGGDDDATWSLSNFVVGPTGLISDFSTPAGPVSEVVTMGTGIAEDETEGMHVRLMSALRNSGGHLVVIAALTNHTGEQVSMPNLARYEMPDGTVVEVDEYDEFSYPAMGTGWVAAVFLVRDGEFGGTFSYDVELADGTLQTHSFPIQRML
ncbi:MAG: hypothetical protein Q4G64_03040 [bacterium]|nr:hypothetical protein [bacterium]